MSGSSSWQICIDGTSRGSGSYAFGPLAIGGSSSGWLYTTQSGTTAASSKINTSNIFNSRNPTSRTAAITLTGFMNANNSISQMYWNGSFTGTGTVTLNAPPTFRVTDSGGTETTQLYFDKQFVYAGLTTASVKVANLSAKYGGTITSATLTIGDQTVSRTNNGELSILLNAGGTFTPTVTVTDSRGQTTTKTLDPITVNVYTTPTVAFEAQRTLVAGVPDDEGTYVVISPKFTFIDVIAELEEPTIVATDEGSITYTPTVTWYSTRASDGTLSGSVIWSNLSTGDTVYGLLSLQSGFDILQSYEISVTPIDSEGTGTAKTQMLAPAFFTIDVLAGGHGIAFGQPASDVGFFCNMDAHFVDANSVMRALFDFVYPVGSYYETSDTTFDPNVTWGGTWALETEGQVHVSSGTNYAVSGALTDTSDGGASTVTLNVNQIPAHGHIPNNWVVVTNKNYASYGDKILTGSAGSFSAKANASQNDDQYISNNTGGGQAHNNMQPYIIVNRWHRTA